MILNNDALEMIRSTIAARGVTSLSDEDPTETELIWALLQDLDDARSSLKDLFCAIDDHKKNHAWQSSVDEDLWRIADKIKTPPPGK